MKQSQHLMFDLPFRFLRGRLERAARIPILGSNFTS